MISVRQGIVGALIYFLFSCTLLGAQGPADLPESNSPPRPKLLEPVFFEPKPAIVQTAAPVKPAVLPIVWEISSPPENENPEREHPESEHGGLDRFWVEGDYLLWWMKGVSLPPFVTTSPAGTSRDQAGNLGAPGTTVLFGNTRDNGEARSGGIITLGYWLNDEKTCGIEASFFMLESRATQFGAGSDGSRILARPFFDVTTGQQQSELVSFPGLIAGNVNATYTSTGLLGAGVWFREALYCGCCECSPYRIDAVIGYRYLRLNDNLSITEDLISTNPNNANFVPLGTTLSLWDNFATSNNFHGLDLGIQGEIHRGRWVLGWLAKVAVGANFEEVEINGSTRVTVPGMSSVTNVGGLLALQSNIGDYSRERFAVVPEVGIKLGYQLTDNLRIQAGYNFLYWSEVVRAGNQIDTNVNPNLLPPVANPVAGPLRPAVNIQGSSFWAQGIVLGLQWNY